MADQEAPEGETPDLGEHYDAVIIGAGVGGLACGALLAKAGRKVLIAERHDRPGGFVTDYERKGYRFQVPHIMGGCGPGGDLTRVMDHLGMKVDFKRVEPYMRLIYPEHDITVSSETGAFAEALKESFQPQTENINRFFRMAAGVRKGLDIRMLRRPRGAGAALKGLAYPFVHPRMLSLLSGRATLEKLLDSFFADEQIKSVMATPWPFLGSPPWELSALSMIAMMNSFERGAFFPLGGYGELAMAFARAFAENGGTLLLGHEVTSVNISDGRVDEVELMPRTRVKTETVISDADCKRTFLNLLERESFPRAFVERLEEGEVSASGFVIHLGMAKALDDPGLACGPVFVQPSYDHREVFEELGVSDRYPDPARLAFCLMVHSALDPSLAPEGRTCLDIMVPAVPYEFKKRWGVEGGVRGERYIKTKEKYAEVVVAAVSRAFPDLIGNVEAYDISTPITYERYTMATDGCWYDWAQVPGQVFGRRPGPRTSLRGLFVTGSKSVLGGGIYASVMSGLLAADSVLGGQLHELF